MPQLLLHVSGPLVRPTQSNPIRPFLTAIAGAMATQAAVVTGKIEVRLNGRAVVSSYGIARIAFISDAATSMRLNPHVHSTDEVTLAAMAEGSQNATALVTFFQILVQKLLFKDAQDGLIDAAADAMLALILCYHVSASQAYL